MQSNAPEGIQFPDYTMEVDDTDDVIGIGQLDVSQMSVKYQQWTARPSAHIGRHYRDVARRYGVPWLAMVLPGNASICKSDRCWEIQVLVAKGLRGGH